MPELNSVLRWLGRAAMFQSTLIFLIHLVLTKRLSTVSGGLTQALYRGNVAAEQVDKVNQAFYSVSSLTVWIFLGGITATGVGYGLLKGIIKKNWPKPSLLD